MEEIIIDCAERAKDQPVYPSKLFPPSIYYRFFKLLAQSLKPKLSVELGVCGGGGSLHLALGNPEGEVIGIDYQYDHPEHIKYIEKTCENFYFYKQDSCDLEFFINDWADIGDGDGLRVDILFIDTVHTYEATLKEFWAWEPYLSPNAVICLDDLFRPGMEEAFNELPGEKLRLDYLKGGERNPGEIGQEGGFGVIYDRT